MKHYKMIPCDDRADWAEDGMGFPIPYSDRNWTVCMFFRSFEALVSFQAFTEDDSYNLTLCTDEDEPGWIGDVLVDRCWRSDYNTKAEMLKDLRRSLKDWAKTQ